MTQRLAILPFVVDSDKLQFLSESIQDLLMRELGISQKYMVISKQSTALASEQSDDIQKIGKQLDAIRLIEGEIKETENIVVDLSYHRLDKKEKEDKPYR